MVKIQLTMNKRINFLFEGKLTFHPQVFKSRKSKQFLTFENH